MMIQLPAGRRLVSVVMLAMAILVLANLLVKLLRAI